METTGRLLLRAFFVLLAGMFLDVGQAQVPSVLSYDGYLVNSNGSPLNGRKDLSFALYTTATSGTAVWQEVHQNIQVNAGVFRVVLGRGTVPQPLNIPFDQQYYLGVRVGNDPEMSPRQELMPSAYSFRARTADHVPDTSLTGSKLKSLSITDEKIRSLSWSKITGINEGVSARIWSLQGNRGTDPSSEFLGTIDGQNLSFRTNNLNRMTLHSGGNVGIGTSNPLYPLHVVTPELQVMQLESSSSTATRLLLKNASVANSYALVVTGTASSLGEGKFFVGQNDGSFLVPRLLVDAFGNVGIGTSNPSSRLHVSGDALFSGNLNSSGNGLFNGTMRVHGLTTMNDATVLGDLNAAGNFIVSGDGQFANLNVFNDAYVGNSLFVRSTQGSSIPLDVQVGSTTRFRVNNDGSTFIYTDPPAGTFAVDVRAKKHGMVLSMNPGGELNSSTKFISFQDGSTIKGRIEGQTATEIDRDPLNIYEAASNGAQIGVAIGLAWVDPGNLIQEIIEKAVYVVRLIAAFNHAGVSYVSGNGDYAEWLPRLNEKEKLEAGDVVGVFGGRISRSTKGAERLMAISTNPIVLGNMPEQSKEHLYEKVAFLGQVPVKVIGVVEEGDYIVCSGRDNGSAVAISPKLMTADEFPKVVGRAWSSSDIPYEKFVNVAVGLTGGDMAPIVKRVENNLRDLRVKQEAAFNTQQEEIAQLRAAVSALQQAVQARESSSLQGSHALSVARGK